MNDLILTCDAGTTGLKCTLFDAAGRAVQSVRQDYGTDYPRPGWAEQDTGHFTQAATGCIRELLSQISPSRIACVGLSGTMNGMIAVDDSGNALTPNIIHSDARADGLLDEIRAVISPEEFYNLTGNRLDFHYTLPKILWLRKNMPDVYARARWFLNTKDFVYGFLTGTMGITDYSDASLTIAMDIRRGVWAEGLLKSLGLDAKRMPQIRPGHDVSGRVSKEAASLTGLLPGTPVSVGGGDGACTSRGAGLASAGEAYCYIGSSAWVAQMTDEPLLDPQARIFNYLDMDGVSNHSCGTVQCGAAAYDWAAANFMGLSELPPAQAYNEMESQARQIAPGAEGVMFLPTLMGERTPYWDANTRGVLMGFTLYHDSRHIARAVYEGVAFALYSCAEVMRECGAPVKSLMLTGGGARSGFWPDIIASVFGLGTRVHGAPGEATSLGSAITAGVGAGIFKTYQEGVSTIRARSAHAVNESWKAAYAAAYATYTRLYPQMKPVFDDIARRVAEEG